MGQPRPWSAKACPGRRGLRPGDECRHWNPLRAYGAVARHHSFTKAALELHVTQSAVSQRIRGLELELGTSLFRRSAQGLELTAEGADLGGAVQRGLAEIAAGLTTFEAGSSSGSPLTVSVLSSFAGRWLVPRLAGLQERHPEIEVQIKADGHLANLHVGEADLAIRFGPGRYPGLRCDLLMGRLRLAGRYSAHACCSEPARSSAPPPWPGSSSCTI